MTTPPRSVYCVDMTSILDSDVVRTYYAVRDTYFTIGTTFDDYTAAVDYALHRSTALHDHNASQINEPAPVTLVTSVQIDTRTVRQSTNDTYNYQRTIDEVAKTITVDAAQFDSMYKRTEQQRGATMGQDA